MDREVVSLNHVAILAPAFTEELKVVSLVQGSGIHLDGQTGELKQKIILNKIIRTADNAVSFQDV